MATKQSQTRDRVRDLIEQLGVGAAIPAERQLSVDLGVTPLTVRAALDDHVREGHLVRRRGSGTFVSQPKIAQELTMTSFSEDMRRRGLSPGSRTLSLSRELAGARLGRFLNVSPGAEIVVVKRLRLADGVSMAIETLHIPAEVVPGFLLLLADAAFDHGLGGDAGVVGAGHPEGVVALHPPPAD